MTAPFVGYAQSLTYTAQQDRYVQASKMLHHAGAMSDNGVMYGNTSNMLVTTPSGMNISVDSGYAMIDNYTVTVPAPQARVVAASTSTARRDLVILRVYDTEAGDATSKADVEIVKGTTTSDPAIPARSIVLAQIDVGANVSSITAVDRRVFTAANGAMKATNAIGGIVAGEITPGGLLYDISTQKTWQRRGATVKPFGANLIASGSSSYPNSIGPVTGWEFFNIGGLTLPFAANVVLVTASLTISSPGSSVGDCSVVLDGEILGPAQWNTAGTRDIGLTYQVAVADRAAGLHPTAYIGVRVTAGNPVQVTNPTYSWVALA